MRKVNTLSDTEMEQTKALQAITDRLDRVIALLAIQGRDLEDQVRILYDFGFDSSFIGKVLARDPSSIRHLKTAKKKPSRKTPARKGS